MQNDGCLAINYSYPTELSQRPFAESLLFKLHGHRGNIPDSTYTQIYYRSNHGPWAELVRGTVSWLIAASSLGTRYKESVASLMDGVDFRYRRAVIIYKDYDTRLVISSCDDTTTP